MAKEIKTSSDYEIFVWYVKLGIELGFIDPKNITIKFTFLS